MNDNENVTEYRRTLRNRILDLAMKEFAKRGIKAVKMDEIAAMLSISKRTLYELYANKEILLYEGLKRSAEGSDARMVAISESSENVMDFLVKAFRIRLEETKMVSVDFIRDLMKYPLILEYFSQNRQRKHDKMLEFFQRGVDEGYFMPDYNYELVMEVFESAERRDSLKKILDVYSVEEIIFNITFVALRGICTPKGIEILDRFVAEYSAKR